MWGDWLLVNAQWALFRYQEAPGVGTSFILGYKDILYIYLGQNTGIYNIAAAVFWTTGAAVLLIGLIITIFAYTWEQSGKIRAASYFTLIGGIFLGLSAICRFNGGFAIPVGVPIILIIGWWMYQETVDADEPENETDDDVPEPE
ncbi:MAG: hypothetical protein NTZ37_00325 [Methanoregula sp.]|nr:hypothetical protein [Methanoregula sp.]